ncbi:MAG: TolC family outer membrane protein, partial [Cocleimonas sp.]
MKNKSLLKFAFINCSLFLSLGFAPIYAENLLQVYEHAKTNDVQLKISEAGFLAALEAKPQVISGLKPQVDITASANYGLNYTGRALSRDDGSAFFNLGYDLTLSKSLINKQLDAQIEQVDASILQSKANLESDRQDLIIRVAESYFEYLNAKETLAFRKSEVVAIGKQLNQAKAFFEAGRSAITDVKEAQAKFDLANAQISVANQQIDVANEQLRAITTRYYKNLNGASDSIPLLIPAPNNIESWAKVAVANSKQLLAAKYGVDIAQGNVDIQHAARNPTINIVARQGTTSTFGDDTVDRDSIDGSVGLQLSMPIFDGGNISSRVRQSRLQLQQARQQLELQKRLAVQQSRAAYLTIVSGLAQVKALRQALNSTQAASNATQAGFEAGTRTAIDVLVSLRETFSARRDYSTARYAFLLNTLRLKQAVGTLT